MNDTKYIGLDVHQATISVAVLDSAGKLNRSFWLVRHQARSRKTGLGFVPTESRRQRQ